MYFQGWLCVRWRHVFRALRDSNVDSGTGPDDVSTRVLLMCAFELAWPIAKLIRRILHEVRWPELWTMHRAVGLHKRKAVSGPDNYMAFT